jgi:GntR family transcriptional regulator
MLIANKSKPLYEQLKEIIIYKVRTNELKPGDPLPGERKLAEIYDVSRVTIRKVISDLANDGILIKHHGKETTVAKPRIENTLGKLLGVIEELEQKKMVISIELLERAFKPIDPIIKKNLTLNAFDKNMFVFSRIIYTNNEPIVLNHSYASENIGSLLQNIDLSKDTVFSHLESLGYNIAYANQTISAALSDDTYSKILNCAIGSPVLEIVRTTYVKDGSPILYEKSIYPSNMYHYKVQLQRSRI